jgi:pyruvate kinase
MPHSAHDRSPVRSTKIVATLGPASQSAEMVRALIEAGADVFRINGSHGDHETHKATIALVREQAMLVGKSVGVLFDLQGPKIRIGKFEGPARKVSAGEEFDLAVGRAPLPGELPTDYALLDKDVKVGHPLLINDGSLASEVIEVEPGRVRCRAKHEGEIAPRKGINLPKSIVSAPAITDKDRQDALFAVSQGVDMIALSFVRRADDVLQLRALLAGAGAQTPIISKIEKPQALDNLDEILQVSWGVMVARGDLGVELSPEDVPMAQKQIIRAANAYARPVITATQMLDSMTRHPRPTRAEASDVANAVLDGTDAVMLSQETAAGLYPVESIEMMVKIIHATEKMQAHDRVVKNNAMLTEGIPEAVAEAGCEVAALLGAKSIVVFTETGRMAIYTSQRRPRTPIMAFAREPAVRNRLCLVWGVKPLLAKSSDTIEDRMRQMETVLSHSGYVEAGDRLVLLVGAPNAPSGSTNVMMVHRIGGE